MKTYTFAKLKPITKTQGYITCALENTNGERILNFNPPKKNIVQALDLIEKRLNADIHPDGVYFVCLARSVHHQKNADRYPITKGNVDASKVLTPVINEKQTVQQNNQEVLTWSEAMKLHSELAELKSKVKYLELENSQLQAELDEIPQEGLNEPKESVLSILKDNAPMFSTALDQWFKTRNRELDLEEKKVHLGITTKKPTQNGNANPKRKAPGQKIIRIEVGTPQHLQTMEHYLQGGEMEKLNAELDKLEKKDEELYNDFCTKHNLFEQEEEEEQEN